MPKDKRPQKTLTARQLRRVETGVEIREREPAPPGRAFMTRSLIQATRPHRQPKNNH